MTDERVFSFRINWLSGPVYKRGLTRAKARYRLYRDYSQYYDVTFREFMGICD